MRVEFYVDGSEKFIACVDDGQAPAIGDLISVLKKTYRVARIGWAVDDAQNFPNAKQRCCVELSSQP